jgi:prepilin-type N-terminal cleavage/methylation domain-containing protein
MNRGEGVVHRASGDRGFTLIEILIAIVLVGIISAVVVIGIGKLTDRASAAGCDASADAARTATSAYFVDNASYPATFVDLTRAVGTSAPPLVVPANAAVAETTLTVGHWRLTMSAGSPPTFSCSTYSTVSLTVVVNAAHPAGWAFLDDNATLGNSGKFVTGPPTPPAGSGSAQLTVAGPTQGSILSNTSFGSLRLDRITNLGYSTFQPPGSLAPVVAFDIRFRPADTGYAGRLVFAQDASLDSTSAVWRSWSPTAGLWYASHANRPNEPQSSLGACPMASPCTWAQVLAQFPDATIAPGGALVFKAGSHWPASSYNVDAFTMGIADSSGKITETTYDFEP